ncbi:MAG: hypothetical protein AAGF04_02480 [Chlamydiota bacterium]
MGHATPFFSFDFSSDILENSFSLSPSPFAKKDFPFSGSLSDPAEKNAYRTGLQKALELYHQGREAKDVSSLQLALKILKGAAKSAPQDFSLFYFWGNLLATLGEYAGDPQYFPAAYAKYQIAREKSSSQDKSVLADFYSQIGSLETLLAEKSGEAIDLCYAIDSFRSALRYQKDPAAGFWIAFGRAYYQMGLFINDNRHYLQAVEHFAKALKKDPQNALAWYLSASSYKELYINTCSEEYCKRASLHYQNACKHDEMNEDLWLDWAIVLHESGKVRQDVKKFRLAVEKCVLAHSLSPNDPRIIGQWVESLSLLGALSSRHDLLIEAENKVIKATTKFPDMPELWYAYAICLGAQAVYYEDPAFYDFALEKIQEGLSIDSSVAELWHVKALFHGRLGSYFSDKKLLALAEKFYAKTLCLKPSCPEVIFDRACNFLEQAELLESSDHAQASCEAFETLFRLQKDALLYHPKWLYQYASALYTLGDLSSNEPTFLRSVEVFWQVLLIEPDFPHIHRKLATCFFQLADFSSDTTLYKKAFHYFRRAAEQDEEGQETWLDWGLSLIQYAHLHYDRQKEWSIYVEAEEKLRKAGALGSEHAFYHLACLYSLMGRFTDAMHLLEMAKERDTLPPVNELVADDWLEPLRKTSHFSQFLYHLENRPL